jgi:hypothetical protein
MLKSMRSKVSMLSKEGLSIYDNMRVRKIEEVLEASITKYDGRKGYAGLG